MKARVMDLEKRLEASEQLNRSNSHIFLPVANAHLTSKPAVANEDIGFANTTKLQEATPDTDDQAMSAQQSCFGLNAARFAILSGELNIPPALFDDDLKFAVTGNAATNFDMVPAKNRSSSPTKDPSK